NAPLAANAPNFGQALMLAGDANYHPQGIRQVKSLWEFTNGIAPASITDWGPILNTAGAYMAIHGGCLYAPPIGTTYDMATAVTFDMSGGGAYSWEFLGEGGIQFPSCVRFRWTGAQYAPAMFTMKGGSAFKCRHIDFDANNLALSTWWLPSANTWSTQACRWEYCGFVSCLSAPYWLPGHAYSSTSNGGFGDVVVGPD